MKSKKETLITGIKPSGNITLGNYLGIIKPLSIMLKNNPNLEIYLFIADLHAITVFQDPDTLKKNIQQIIKIYLSSDLNLDQINLFIQSDIKEHTFLSYLMESTAYTGEMNRMINYKQIIKNHKITSTKTRTSLFTYPALMAADILLYDVDYVLVGIDQKQHLELTKVLANRFNNLYGDIFKIPAAIDISRLGNKINSLSQPEKKMSKSNDDNGCIYLLEDLSKVKNKIMRAITDSDDKIYYNPQKKPGISNLLTIFSILKKINIQATENHFKNHSYLELKKQVSQTVIQELSEIQQKVNNINNQDIHKILQKNSYKIKTKAQNKILKIQQLLGLGFF